MSILRKRALSLWFAWALGGSAAAQSFGGMLCNLSSPPTTIQTNDTTAQLGDLVLTCTGGYSNLNTTSPVPTANWTLTLPAPVTSPILSTSGGNVSDVLLFIDDAASAPSGSVAPPDFGSNAPPTVCAYSASSTKGCPAYPNVAGGVAVLTSAPNPLGSPNPNPPAANIYQGVVNGNAITFFGVPILPPSTTGARTYRFTNIRMNAAVAGAGAVVGSLTVQGYGAALLSLNQTQATMALPQFGNTVFSAGYSLPAPVNVAPGQIANFFVQGVGSKLTGPVSASNFPLPTVLAGISVALTQTVSPSGPTRLFPVPLLAVRPVSTCAFLPPSVGCGSYAVITVQIPFEIFTPDPTSPQVAPLALVVSENGIPGSSFELHALSDQFHAATSCDVGSVCDVKEAIITHANGTRVYSGSPAEPGEELVMYAFGLGATTPAVGSGQAAPAPAPVLQPPQLNFDYRPNAAPSRSLTLPPACATSPSCPQLQPVFAGLTPGYAGLYQVNFVVPPPPPGTPACNATFRSDPSKPLKGIASNLTVSIIGPNSFDGGGICVDTGAS